MSLACQETKSIFRPALQELVSVVKLERSIRTPLFGWEVDVARKGAKVVRLALIALLAWHSRHCSKPPRRGLCQRRHIRV